MITMGIWYTNVGFLIYSKSVLLTFENRISYVCDFIPGIVVVSN
jgi:hypothetical protein